MVRPLHGVLGPYPFVLAAAAVSESSRAVGDAETAEWWSQPALQILLAWQ
jgi:hypothetical protein